MEHLRRCLEIKPEIAHANILLAENYLDQGLIDKALKQINAGLTHSSHRKLWFAKARIEAAAGFWDQAYESIREIDFETEDKTECLELALNIAEVQKDDYLCLALLEKLVALGEQNYSYCLKLAKIKQENGLIDESKKFFDLALDLNPSDESCILKVVNFYLACGRDIEGMEKQEIYKFVENNLLKLKSQDPNNTEVTKILSELYYQTERFEEIYKMLNEYSLKDFIKQTSLTITYKSCIYLNKHNEAKNALSLAFKSKLTRGEASYFLADISLHKKEDDTLRFSLISVFHLRKNLRFLIKEFEMFKSAKDFYSANSQLLKIDAISNMISEAYLIYYQFQLHILKNLCPRAISLHKHYKRN